MSWLPKFLRRTACAHEFWYADLHLTGIPVPPMPDDFNGAMEWYHNQYSHPSHSERVSWSCHKCGKEFRAHCGLDIIPHGTPIKIFRYDLDNGQRPAGIPEETLHH